MLIKSENYQTIWENPLHYAETKIVCGDTTYGEDAIYGIPHRSQTLYGEGYDIGNATMGSIDFQLIGVTDSELPTKSRVEVWTRLCVGYGAEKETTNYLPMGVYYLANPDYDTEFGLLTCKGYDEMFKTNVVPFTNGSEITAWSNPTLRQVANHLASGTDVSGVIATNFAGIGIELEDETQVPNTITIPNIPFEYSARELLQEIAVASGGNWLMVFKEVNGVQVAKLRLAKLNDIPAQTSLLIDEYGSYLVFGDTRIIV